MTEAKIPRDFRGFAGHPKSELEVIFLFGLLIDHIEQFLNLPLVVTRINDIFPDCECIDPLTEKPIHIEFELKSSHYKAHGHPQSGCEYIVCWEDDWPNAPVPVISLKTIADSINHQDSPFLYIPSSGSVRQVYEDQTTRNPEVYQAIGHFLNFCVPTIKKLFPHFYVDEDQTRHFVFRNRPKQVPLLEIHPNGKLFGRSVQDLVSKYGEEVREAASKMKNTKDNIGILRNPRDADKLTDALKDLLLVIQAKPQVQHEHS